MDPMTLMALSQAGQGGGAGLGAIANIGRAGVQEKERQDMERYKKLLEKNNRRDLYRNALTKAMGYGNPFISFDPTAPKARSTYVWDILGGAGAGLGAASQMTADAASRKLANSNGV